MFKLHRCYQNARPLLGPHGVTNAFEVSRNSAGKRTVATWRTRADSMDAWSLSTGKLRSQYARSMITLDANRLTSADCVELNGFNCAVYDRQYLKWDPEHRVWCRLVTSTDQPYFAMLRYIYTRKAPSKTKGTSEKEPSGRGGLAAWPPGTIGFFYFYRRPDLSVKTGQIRFRVVPSADPRRFKVGKDLLYPSGLPWSLPAAYACGKPHYRMFGAMLARDGIITEEVMKELADDAEHLGHRNHILNALNEPFAVDFSNGLHKMYIVGEGPPSLLNLEQFLVEHRRQFRAQTPYSGKAICQFEQAPSSPPRAGRPMVGLRILKLLEPVNTLIPDYDGLIGIPKEGEFMTRAGAFQPLTLMKDDSLEAIRRFCATAPKEPVADVGGALVTPAPAPPSASHPQE